ncbi:hypothetical protein [Albibacterium indicum]|nr:hypothetical protein [Pedobacter indicus]
MSSRNSGQAFDLHCYVRENMIDFIQKTYPKALSRTRVSIERD